MEINVVAEEGNAVIRLKGRFDFSTHREFRAAIEQAMQESYTRKIRVDLGGVDYLDSSALGMLLILRDRALDAGRQTRITGSTGNVRNVLAMCNIGQLIPLD